jgi:hypothetical protein
MKLGVSLHPTLFRDVKERKIEMVKDEELN